MQKPIPADTRNIFIDESSQNNHARLVIGGIICKATDHLGLCQQIAEARSPGLPSGEMKWTKVSRSKLPYYRRVVDTFFDSKLVVLEFHSLCVEMAKRNDTKFNQGSREIGFNKEVYQLLLKFGRLYRTGVFHVYPDKRETTSSTEELRLILNRGILKKGDSRDWPYRRLHFRDSRKEPIIQIVDILTGAVAFSLNHRKSADASPSKCELSDYILDRAKITDPFRDTAVSGKFTLWHRRLRGVPQS